MKHNPLGRTDITVPEICLGTMTWGSQNSEAEAHAQIDLALDHGVNFLDTAELYPTYPQGPDRQGRTEAFIGSWLRNHGGRDRLIIASKVAGAGPKHIRGGGPITGADIRAAVETSLERLGTDYIDLYQLHWPNRGHYHFRRQWSFDPTGQSTTDMRTHVEDVLDELQRQVDAGRIRAVGLSNETAWGTMQFVDAAKAGMGPRMASIQNEYSLLYRTFDLDLAEVAHHENVGLLAYTPLAAGLLTGKYAGGAIPPSSRGSIDADVGGRRTARAIEVADIYVGIARKHGLDPAQMALAFCLKRPFMTSVIIGATDLTQLKTNIRSVDLTLSDEVMEDITQAHRNHPSPY